jgi:hypothetical protein
MLREYKYKDNVKKINRINIIKLNSSTIILLVTIYRYKYMSDTVLLRRVFVFQVSQAQHVSGC